MHIKTMEGLVGARTNMNLVNTPMRVYRDAERRGDLAVMERALGYAGEFASKAVEYQATAEEGMEKDAEAAREEQANMREEAIQAHQEEQARLEAQTEKAHEEKKADDTQNAEDTNPATAQSIAAPQNTVATANIQASPASPMILTPGTLPAPTANTAAKITFYGNTGKAAPAMPSASYISVRL